MTRGRVASLRAAVLLAVGFVALRVLYRVVFGGVGGSGVTVFDLPRIRLGGPFEHIVLLGPVTTGGLAATVTSALPFAALVLAIGVLAALVDLRALFARGAVRGPVRTISRAVVVAWATFPSLVGAVRRVRVARELRGERGMASLVVPVLEQTVERAIALGTSMEVRGFAATRRAEPDCQRPVVLDDVSLGFEGRWILEGVTLSLEPGTLVLVTGPTGSGKSTLLHALSGLFQHVSGGDQAGSIEIAGANRIEVPPRETAGFVGVVWQSPRMSFLAATVEQEIGFALANRGVAPVILRARVGEVAERLGISSLLDREVTALSAGEACLVAIGGALVEQPVVLLVDEPLAELDSAARARCIDVLDRLAHEAGVCVVVTEHALAEWGARPDELWALEAGSVRRRSADELRTMDQSEPLALVTPPPPVAEPVAEVRHVSVSHGDRLAVRNVSFSLDAGELVALTGPNGAGKSSLLDAIARPQHPATVLVGDDDVQGLGRKVRRRRVALVPESFDDLLFANSVAEECQRADRRVRGAHTRETFATLLGGPVADLLSLHPRDLSAGQRLCLAIAIQLSARPDVLLVDEPARGLDATARELVGRALLVAAASGSTVVFATHDAAFARRFATRTVSMADGALVHASGVRA